MHLTILERFVAKIATDDRTSCWEWRGSTNRGGYAWFAVGGRSRSAHRVAYEMFVGPIPEGLEIDHICRVRHCVNPAHLEAVTRKENVHRGIAPPAVNAKKTHCNYGHALSGLNVYHEPRGGRQCRTCQRMRGKEHARLIKGQTPPSHGVSGYSNYGCRCQTCVEARSRWARDRYKARSSSSA